MQDERDEEEFIKRYPSDGTSPLKRAEDPERWRQWRMESLREVIKGPAYSEDWDRAKEEYDDLRRGYSYGSYGDEIDFGR